MSRVVSMSDPAVDALFEGFGSTAFRLATRQTYKVSSEAPALRAFLRGEMPRDVSGIGGWWEEVRAGTAAGKSYQRVQVVQEPVTAYMRFVFAWAYRRSAAVGEDVRVLPVGAGEMWPAGIPRADFWLFDGARLLELAYDEDGALRYVEIVDDAEAVERAVEVRDRALRLAVPFDEYLTRAIDMPGFGPPGHRDR